MIWVLIMICIILCLFLVIHVKKFYAWKSKRNDKLARITYERFIELYSKKSSCWTFSDDCVRLNGISDEWIEFESYIDVIKYKSFCKRILKERYDHLREENQTYLEKMIAKMFKEN